MNDGLSRELLLEIAKNYGTPVYVYNADYIQKQFISLTKAFSQLPCRIFYASKALTNIHVLRYIHSLGASIDCSSINELKLAQYAGVPSEDILYTSNGIHISEIEQAQQSGAHINIDSLSNLEKFGQRYGNTYPIGIRLRPNVMAGGNLNISTGHDKSKFGIPVNHLDEILQVVGKYKLHITALHIHTGSEISDVEMFMKGVQVLLGITKYFPDLKYVDLGGGFKVPYKENDPETDIEKLAQEIGLAMNKLKEEQGRELQIWLEPGKFLVSAAGYLLTKVNVIKTSSVVTFAGVDTGFNHLIRPMFYGSYHRIDNLSNPSGKLEKYAVVGNICETDTFAWDREIAEIREEDILCFRNAGAYGFEMSSNFNSRFRPPEVFVTNGVPQLIRRRETIDDLLKCQLINEKNLIDEK